MNQLQTMVCPTYKLLRVEIGYTFAQSELKLFERDVSNVATGVKLRLLSQLNTLNKCGQAHVRLSPQGQGFRVCNMLSKIVLFT